MPHNVIRQKELDKQTAKMYTMHYTLGITYEMIGQKYGITKQAVYLRLKNYINRYNLK